MDVCVKEMLHMEFHVCVSDATVNVTNLSVSLSQIITDDCSRSHPTADAAADSVIIRLLIYSGSWLLPCHSWSRQQLRLIVD